MWEMFCPFAIDIIFYLFVNQGSSVYSGVPVVLGDVKKDYMSLVSTLESVKNELDKTDISKPILKRELFKCIDIVKNMVAKLEKEWFICGLFK